jgi:hypothetical protein
MAFNLKDRSFLKEIDFEPRDPVPGQLGPHGRDRESRR